MTIRPMITVTSYIQDFWSGTPALFLSASCSNNPSRSMSDKVQTPLSAEIQAGKTEGQAAISM